MARTQSKVESAKKNKEEGAIKGLKKSSKHPVKPPIDDKVKKSKKKGPKKGPKTLKAKRIHTILEQQGREFKLPKQTFKNIFKYVVQGICDENLPYARNEIRFNAEAMRMFHKSVEDFIFNIFEASTKLAGYKGRVTLYADDIYFCAKQTQYGAYLLARVIDGTNNK